MNTMLEGLQGVLCLMDDVLVYDRDQEDHEIGSSTPKNTICRSYTQSTSFSEMN